MIEIGASPHIKRLFLHFFDIHFLDTKGIPPERPVYGPRIEQECNTALRFAVLSADEVYVPAASYFESPLCSNLLGRMSDLFDLGLIRLIGGGDSVQEFADEKRGQYAPNSTQGLAYSAVSGNYDGPALRNRIRSASKDISSGWRTGAANDLLGRLFEKATKKLETNWDRVPEKLEGRAFIYEHVHPLLGRDIAPVTAKRIKAFINEEYFSSFTRELNCGVVTELFYLESDFDVISYSRDLPYKTLLKYSQRYQLHKRIVNADSTSLLELRSSTEWQACLTEAMREHTLSLLFSPRRGNGLMEANLSSASTVIITALPKEFAAVCQVFDAKGPVTRDGVRYAISRIRTRNGVDRLVAVSLLPDTGNNQAAARATLASQHCPGAEIFMVGIAGAIPCVNNVEDHVRLGDIVVCNRGGVIQYDFIKKGRIDEPRHPPRPPSANLLNAVQWLKAEEAAGNRVWDRYIDEAIMSLGADWSRPSDDHDRFESSPGVVVPHPHDSKRRQGRPSVFHGPIASANILLKDARVRDRLQAKYKAKAVEMEGAGIADATWSLDAGYLVVRGTCDYCDFNKGDLWQNYASIIAAAYTRAILEID